MGRLKLRASALVACAANARAQLNIRYHYKPQKRHYTALRVAFACAGSSLLGTGSSSYL